MTFKWFDEMKIHVYFFSCIQLSECLFTLSYIFIALPFPFSTDCSIRSFSGMFHIRILSVPWAPLVKIFKCADVFVHNLSWSINNDSSLRYKTGGGNHGENANNYNEDNYDD